VFELTGIKGDVYASQQEAGKFCRETFVTTCLRKVNVRETFGQFAMHRDTLHQLLKYLPPEQLGDLFNDRHGVYLQSKDPRAIEPIKWFSGAKLPGYVEEPASNWPKHPWYKLPTQLA